MTVGVASSLIGILMDSYERSAKVDAEGDLDTLNVGTRIRLETQRNGLPDVQLTTLLGFSKGDFLIVKCPVVRNVPYTYYDSESVLVRAFTGTTIFTFSSFVTRTLLSPMYYMHLAFPESVTTSSLRSSLRVKVEFTGMLTYQDLVGSEQTAPAQFLNLSQSGAAIAVEEALVVGHTVQAAFTVDDEGTEIPISVSAVVRSQTRRPPVPGRATDMYTYGIEFVGIKEEQQNALRVFAYGRALQDRRNIA